MHVIGTAGHVDHGKSTLIKALTGIDPDRLKEEKEREMTIDLGFAWLDIGDGSEIGVVDVPGHSDFIENMLAGVGGLDIAILVIAADEGVMPQTREHLAILDLLEIRDGIVALTKVDLVEDPDWLVLVTLDIEEVLADTILEGVEIIPVSAHSGTGLARLKAAIVSKISRIEPREDKGQPRLPIDRVFSLPGFGTIVTGTLIGGHFLVGDGIEIMPGSLRGRIRGIQTHKTKMQKAAPGSRVAINLTGIDKEAIERGMVITRPGLLPETTLLDVQYRHLNENPKPLKHNVEVKLFTGSAEVVARTRVLGSKEIAPGESGWLQLALREPVAALSGDHFILRRPSPAATVGGGTILDPVPGKQHKRFKPGTINRLATIAHGSPEELLFQTIAKKGYINKSELKLPALDRETTELAIAKTLEQGKLVLVREYLFSGEYWRHLSNRLKSELRAYHEKYPLRKNMPKEELRGRLGVGTTPFSLVLEESESQKLVKIEMGSISLSEHRVTYSDRQRANVESMLEEMKSAGINALSPKQAIDKVTEDVYYSLLEQGELQQVSNDVVYPTQIYRALVKSIIVYLEENGSINAAQLRDMLQTSRKYAIPLLEQMDQEKITRRVGDERLLLKKPQDNGTHYVN